MRVFCLSKAEPNESLTQPYFNSSLVVEDMKGIPFLPAVFPQNLFWQYSNGKQYETLDKERKSDDLMNSSAITVTLIDRIDIW